MARSALGTVPAIGVVIIVAIAAGAGVILVGIDSLGPGIASTSVASATSTSSSASSTMSTTSSAPTIDYSKWSALFGSWRTYSAVLYYDAGGGGGDPVATYNLIINQDGTWSYSSSHGTWTVATIMSADWVRWHNQPQSNMTQKIVLYGWDANGTRGAGDGPLQYSSGRIDFVWIMFHVGPPITSSPGEIFLKFGHANLGG